jgi:hypothetical protein
MPIPFHIDLLSWESTYFDLDLDEVIVPIHEAAVTRLHEIHSDAELKAQEEIRAAEMAEHEDEHQFSRDMANEEEKRAREREQVVGWLALMDLVMVFHLKLRRLLEVLTRIAEAPGMAQALDNPQRGKKEGEKPGWLFSLSDQYRRLGIDLASKPEFTVIQELVLARNDVEHNGGKLGTSYQRLFPHPKFSNGETIVFSNQDFGESVKLLKEYVRWIVCELKHLQDGEKPLDPLQRPRPRICY